MPLILITGLDGSGKSSLLGRLQKAMGTQAAFLRVPAPETDPYRLNPPLVDAVQMINQAGELADRTGDRNLKTASMFWAMLLFREFLDEIRKTHSGVVFCERHPIVDTPVYGKVYLKTLDPALKPGEEVRQLVAGYPGAYNLIASGLGHAVNLNAGTWYPDFLRFLKEWFSHGNHFAQGELQMLFRVPLPDRVIFLDAPPEILIKRISSRRVKEYHETLENLQRMRPVYIRLLDAAGYPVRVVNTEDPDTLGDLLGELAGPAGAH